MAKESSWSKVMEYFNRHMLNKKSKLRKEDIVSKLQDICKTIEEIIPNTKAHFFIISQNIALLIRFADANQKIIGYFQVKYNYVEEEKLFKYESINYFLDNENYTLTQLQLVSNLVLMAVEDLI